jgi:hypothetical protein
MLKPQYSGNFLLTARTQSVKAQNVNILRRKDQISYLTDN